MLLGARVQPRNGLLNKADEQREKKKSLSLISLLAPLKGNKKRQNARGLIFKPWRASGSCEWVARARWALDALNVKKHKSSTSFYSF
jgi:hypothetical protein